MTHIAIQENLDGKVVEWNGKGKRCNTASDFWKYAP